MLNIKLIRRDLSTKARSNGKRYFHGKVLYRPIFPSLAPVRPTYSAPPFLRKANLDLEGQ